MFGVFGGLVDFGGLRGLGVLGLGGSPGLRVLSPQSLGCSATLGDFVLGAWGSRSRVYSVFGDSCSEQTDQEESQP